MTLTNRLLSHCFILATSLISLLSSTQRLPAFEGDRPNVVIIFADDLGYGDLGCYGSPTIKTPVLDRLAAEGQKWTSFYTAASVCTPSRAGLLTGRLPVRSGMCGKGPRVIRENGKGGMPADELMLGEYLQSIGYATGCFGKWHLGHEMAYLPRQQGFDAFYGLRYSNDMDRKTSEPGYWEVCANPRNADWFTRLLRGNEIVTSEFNQELLTNVYTKEAVRFIEEQKNGPFFLYLPHSMPHVPLFRSQEFQGTSAGGIYGDVIEELDWSVGQIVAALQEHKLAENTLLLFTSDNGPWIEYKTHGGSAGMLRAGKGSTFEGGFRVPSVFWSPGNVQPRTVTGMGTTLDVLPTVLAMTQRSAGQANTQNRLDGYDLSGTLFGKSDSPRNEVFYYRGDELFAVRVGNFKAHFKTQPAYFAPKETTHNPPLLYDLAADPGEKYDVAAEHPEIVERLTDFAERHRQGVTPVKNQLQVF